jgi:uncharacterized RDD family membrane protein YckC
VPQQPLPFETASWGRRVLALFVDWFAASLVVIVILGPARFFADQSASPDALPSLLTLVVFVVESAVLTWLSGGSFGKLATRLRTVRIDGSGRHVGLLGALGRTILVAAVIPPLVFRPDGRGLHDLMAGTATVTLQTAKGPSTGPSTGTGV